MRTIFSTAEPAAGGLPKARLTAVIIPLLYRASTSSEPAAQR
jgi:hypothetical protein